MLVDEEGGCHNCQKMIQKRGETYMNLYHKDLPEKWIDIIEKDEVLKEIFLECAEYEPVPDFLFQELRGDLTRLKPVFELYGTAGLEMFAKLEEIDALTRDTAQKVLPDGSVAYAGYFYRNPKNDAGAAKEIVMNYIKAINDIYKNEMGEDVLLDEDAQIEVPALEEAAKIRKELDEAWCSGGASYMPEMDMYEDIDDWFSDIEPMDGCEELEHLLHEPLYHISNDYFLSYYIQWSFKNIPKMENPFLPHYQLWCMGLRARFAAKDKVIVV